MIQRELHHRWYRHPEEVLVVDPDLNVIYKVIFDARRKICRALVASGYLEESGLEQR